MKTMQEQLPGSTAMICFALVLLAASSAQPAAAASQDSEWMTSMWGSIKDKPISSVWLPGSHDTLTYDLSTTATTSSTEGATAVVYDTVGGAVTRAWAITQTLTAQGQLDAGIRYMDIRPVYDAGYPYQVVGSPSRISYDAKSPVPILKNQHTLVSNQHLDTYISEIGQWLDAKTAAGKTEVVILHFKNYAGTWNAQAYTALAYIINRNLGKYLAGYTRVSASSTMSEILSSSGPNKGKGSKAVVVFETDELQFMVPDCYKYEYEQGPIDDLPGAAGERTEELNPQACHQRCLSVPDCAFFNWWPDKGCHLASKAAKASPKPMSGVFSGKRSCDSRYTPGYVYQPLDDIHGAAGTRSTESSARDCEARCGREPACAFFTFYKDGGCHLSSAAAKLTTASDDVKVAGRRCYTAGKAYKPLSDLPNGAGDRTNEVTADACKQRCAAVSGCAYFTYYKNGGCHLSSKAAKLSVDNMDIAAAGAVSELCNGTIIMMLDYNKFMSRPYPETSDIDTLIAYDDKTVKNRDSTLVTVVEGVLTPSNTDVTKFTASYSVDGYGAKISSYLLYWEEVELKGLSRRFLGHIQDNWVGKQGMVIMIDNPHASDNAFIYGLNGPTPARYTSFDYGTCSANYKVGQGCFRSSDSCNSGGSRVYHESNSLLSSICKCSCCTGPSSDSGLGGWQTDCGCAINSFGFCS